MLKLGIYEEIINKHLKEELSHLDDQQFTIEKESMDVEDARKMLSSYISHITRKALNYVRDHHTNDTEALLEQVRTCNDIITTLSLKLDEEEFQALQIEEEGEVLTSIYLRINSLSNMKNETVIRPVTPISQSSLFTGSSFEPNMLNELKKEILSMETKAGHATTTCT